MLKGLRYAEKIGYNSLLCTPCQHLVRRMEYEKALTGYIDGIVLHCDTYAAMECNCHSYNNKKEETRYCSNQTGNQKEAGCCHRQTSYKKEAGCEKEIGNAGRCGRKIKS